jgi:hypothetical protein
MEEGLEQHGVIETDCDGARQLLPESMQTDSGGNTVPSEGDSLWSPVVSEAMALALVLANCKSDLEIGEASNGNVSFEPRLAT